jgi:hypothetical protein
MSVLPLAIDLPCVARPTCAAKGAAEAAAGSVLDVIADAIGTAVETVAGVGTAWRF